MPISGVVFNIMRYCVRDGPGIRTTVFLKGCPLRCTWCHNPEGQRRDRELSFFQTRCVGCGDCLKVCPNGAVARENGQFVTVRTKCKRCGKCVEACHAEAREWSGREMTVDEVMREVLRDQAFYEQSGGGVTFSGGEPLWQADFLEAMLKACRARGVRTAIETSGFASWETLEWMSAWTDLFLYDLKWMNDEGHHQLTGVSNTSILENLSRLSLAGNVVVVRMPILPGVNDGANDLRAAARFLRSKTKVREVHLLPFHRIGRDKAIRLGRDVAMPDLQPPGPEAFPRLAEPFEQEGIRVKFGG